MSKKNLLRILVLSMIVSILSFYNAFAKCGSETRQTIDYLMCNEQADGTWYRIDVNKMCGTRSGVEQACLELVERRPNFVQYQKRIFLDQLPTIIYEHKGKREFSLFKQRAGKNGVIEAFAIVSEDGKSIDKVKLHIKSNSENECAKIVDVSDAWNTKW